MHILKLSMCVREIGWCTVRALLFYTSRKEVLNLDAGIWCEMHIVKFLASVWEIDFVLYVQLYSAHCPWQKYGWMDDHNKNWIGATMRWFEQNQRHRG